LVEQRTENPRVTSSSLVPGKLKQFNTNNKTAMQTNFVYKVYQIYRQNYVNKKKLIGISSGNDSMVLLLLMNPIQLLINQPIHLIHCNHFYQKYNFYYIREIFKVTYLLNSTLIISSPIKQSYTETINRDWRQRIFIRGLVLKNIQDLFLAHTQNDKNETFLFNLIRGTTLQGCSNFTTQKLKFETSCFSSRNNKQKLTLNTKQLFKFNRPLLTFSRTELKNLSKLNCLPYTLDPSNLDIKFTRNRIRLIVFPILKKYVKFNFEKQFIKFLIQAENDSKYFEFTTNKLIRSMNCNNNLIKIELKKLPKPFQYKILNLLIKTYSGRDVSFNLIDKLIGKI
jgi:tRNA(Ile)-lysidine synthase